MMAGEDISEMSYCVNTMYSFPGKVFSSPVLFSPGDGDSVLLVGCRDNMLYCIPLR